MFTARGVWLRTSKGQPLCGAQGPRAIPSASWHVPRAVLQALQLADPYANAKTTFCVVRDPFHRAVSEFSWFVQNSDAFGARVPCVAEELNRFLQSRLKRVRGLGELWPWPDALRNGHSDYTAECHFLPQWMYVLGANASAPHLCEHVLRHENLTAEFAQFVSRLVSISLARSAASASEGLGSRSDNRGSCQLRVTDLDGPSVEAIRQIYAEDFRLFGYASSPTVVHSVSVNSKT